MNEGGVSIFLLREHVFIVDQEGSSDDCAKKSKQTLENEEAEPI